MNALNDELTVYSSPDVSVVPRIAELLTRYERPLWSVMIPTYNCARYLPETLRSVLSQALEPEQMQIEVVDDCSTLDDPEAVVKEIGQGRVSFHRKQSNEGATRTFNTCIERSNGRLVHILHGDDAVRSGYYERISALASQYPELGLYAARCFYIDEDSVITAVTPRLKTLELPGRSVVTFFDGTPIQFAGITVRREAYEQLGGFRLDLVHAADCEMWARVISHCGGVVLSEPLASYRHLANSDSSRLIRIAENVRDLCRLNEVFSKSYPEFSFARGEKHARSMALKQYYHFLRLGDQAAADQNFDVWTELAPVQERVAFRLKNFLGSCKRRIFNVRNAT